ncbi:MAG: 5-dehydro-2-deoxygluconokinase [Chloroflexi bacterium]|nr:5-dehydro-2-deoxygluconokinase [Chloroflexota bacterium]
MNPYDLISIGRACLDLYANEIGVALPEVKSFAAYVGGCPANVAVGAARLGLKVAMVSAVGADPVGDFVQRFLAAEGIETKYISRKPQHRTGAAALSIMPPDRFPLIYYRENAADIQLDIDDVLAAPFAQARAVLISGTGLSKEPSRSATLLAAEQARAAGATTFLDLDLRTDQWHDPRAYGVTMRAALRSIDVVIGTEDELRACNLHDPSQLSVRDSQVSSANVTGDLAAAVQRVLDGGPRLVVVKQGRRGAALVEAGREPVEIPGFPVEILNTLGAGDAFAGGLLYGFAQGWDWPKAARLGNACGAIVVTRHACSSAMPTMAEVEAFVHQRGETL